LKINRITDGTSNTIAFVERKTPVCWMSPEDVTFEDAEQGVNKIPTGIGSEHAGGANSAFCDGSVRFLSNTIDKKILRALLTIAGGESVNWP
jgi:prepilin-type processing-associated H-X9-DG protein